MDLTQYVGWIVFVHVCPSTPDHDADLQNAAELPPAAESSQMALVLSGTS